ncbi:hypothetical protein FB446DRAFT_707851 [Lentinula raphanica]|nr:hypothetical protein FB446DRAFT_707851 [Lentinula raphanica]
MVHFNATFHKKKKKHSDVLGCSWIRLREQNTVPPSHHQYVTAWGVNPKLQWSTRSTLTFNIQFSAFNQPQARALPPTGGLASSGIPSAFLEHSNDMRSHGSLKLLWRWNAYREVPHFLKESVGAKLQQTLDGNTSDSDTKEAEQKKTKQTTLDVKVLKATGKKKEESMRAEAQLRVDHLIIRLICARGLVPEILNSPEWQELLKTMNPKIKVKTSKVFRDELIPKEAIFVRQEQHKALSEISTNIRRKDTIYTVHAIKPSREAYLLDGAQGASENHTAEWVKGKIIPVSIASVLNHPDVLNDYMQQIMKSIGVANWAGCVSDSTSTTAKVRAGIAEEIPTVVNLDDCVHLLHNMIDDISKLAAFKEPLNIIKSGLATNRLLEYRRAQSASNAVSDKFLRIQKPVGTRFGSLHTSAMSLLPNLPAIQSLVADKQIKFLNAPKIQKLSREVQAVIARLHIDPVIRALWSLEAADANASDVFVFWLAIAGYLDEMMKRPEGATGIPANVTPEVKTIYNTRYSSQDFLKPNLTITIPSTQPHQNPSVSQQSAALRTPFPDAYERLKEVLKKLLRDVLYLPENDSDECRERLFGECSKVAIADSLKTQVEDFWYGRRPFNAPLSQRTSLEWWRRLQRNSNANVLAFLAIKIFSISVNSMTDERTNSYITWLNSPLRGNQLVGTLIDMIQVGQWYRKKSDDTTIKKQPVVGFRFIEAERLERIKEAELNAAEEGDDEDLNDRLEPNDDNGDEANDDDEFDIDTPIPPREPEFRIDRHINLRAPALRDLISLTPVLKTMPAPIGLTSGATDGTPANADEPMKVWRTAR